MHIEGGEDTMKPQKQVIISIGREFGSAGHEIAERIAKRYGLSLYDHNLLREVGVPASWRTISNLYFS